MTRSVVLVAGSPAENSRSSRVLEALGRSLQSRGFEPERYAVGDFALDELVYGRAEGESVQRFLRSIANARAVVFSTPVYKATYAGALKLIIDLIAPTGLEHKALLAITTARLEPHLALVDESFQRLYAFFQGSIGLRSLGLNDAQLRVDGASGIELDASARVAFDEALARLLGAVQ